VHLEALDRRCADEETRRRDAGDSVPVTRGLLKGIGRGMVLPERGHYTVSAITAEQQPEEPLMRPEHRQGLLTGEVFIFRSPSVIDTRPPGSHDHEAVVAPESLSPPVLAPVARRALQSKPTRHRADALTASPAMPTDRLVPATQLGGEPMMTTDDRMWSAGVRRP
jgi:hypothetical protein